MDDIFEQNADGQWVFKDNTKHTMRIFYMERGAGASNLHMRFNLASIKPGTVLLNKELSGVDAASDTVLAEFPYQIKYKWPGDETEYYLTNASAEYPNNVDYVLYKDTDKPVEYLDNITFDGLSYQNVFMLKPGETAEISFPTRGDDPFNPETIETYSIVECGINTDVYQRVCVNEEEITGTETAGHANRKDYETSFDTTEERPNVKYQNEVNPDALRSLEITKQLYDETGQTELHQDNATFDFRLYMATEFDGALANNPANMHTYHVRDEQGNYCRWDVGQQKLVPIGNGKNDFNALTPEEQEIVTFNTSTYGAISKIPAFYTVEIKNVLAGTQYRVEERPWEVPDGYSFLEYDWDDERDVADYIKERGNTGVYGVEDTIVSNKDPHVLVRNLKGWGLRINKVWTDHDYMSDRDATYYAVYVRDGDGLTIVGDNTSEKTTVRRLTYTKNASDQTVYWYFDTLPVTGTTFDQYEIYEVTVSGDDITVDGDGKVIGYDSITRIEEGDRTTLQGTQKGEADSAAFTYTVSYERGAQEEDSNVRVDKVTNERPGIVLRKTAWDGTPLAGATFTLKRDDDVIGTFTSDEEGQVTVAYLSDDVDYTLTETKAPQGYDGLQDSVTIRLHQNLDETSTVYVSGGDADYYNLTQGDEETPATLTIKDRPYTFRALKEDTHTGLPMQGVSFALHRQVTVDGVTSIDLNPMPGFEMLVTNEDGIIPLLDNTLPAGTYELRELVTPDGYENPSGYTQFTISPLGEITLSGNHPKETSLERTIDEESGEYSYVMTIKNTKMKELRFKKVDIAYPNDSALEGAIFDLYEYKDGALVEPALYTDITSGNDGIVFDPDDGGNTVFKLPAGTYHLVETKAPDGYYIRDNPVIITINYNNGVFDVAYNDGSSTSSQRLEPDEDGVYTIKVTNSSGVVLPDSGGPGTTWIYLLGSILLLVSGFALVARRRLRRESE